MIRLAPLFALLLLLPGCASPLAQDAAEPVAMDVETSYDSKYTPVVDRGQGPPAGSPASGAELLVVLVDPEQYDTWRTVRDDPSPRAHPATPPKVDPGSTLSLDEGKAYQRYRMDLDGEGRARFSVGSEVLVSLEVYDGTATGSSCPAWLVPGDPVEAAPSPSLRLTVPFGIQCKD